MKVIMIFLLCVSSVRMIGIVLAPDYYQRLAIFEINNCDGYTFHGRALDNGCVTFAKHVKSRSSEIAIGKSIGSLLLKYIADDDNSEVEFYPFDLDQTNMKYKAFLPNMKNDLLDDLDSKLPYVVFTASSYTPVLLEPADNPGRVLKIVIFSCNEDLDDFLYENAFDNYTRPVTYAVKRKNEVIVGNDAIRQKEMPVGGL